MLAAMRAVIIEEYGGPEVLRVAERPDPSVRPRDVLIAVRATALNPVDYKIRRGGQRAVVRKRLPAVLGMDVAGVIVAVGAEVSRFAVGDEVFASPTHRRDGTYAELVAIDEGAVARRPQGISWEEAAGIPLAGLTAWGCLVSPGRDLAGARVLVQAGSGGVGTLAIQIAKHLGATVATTCSARNAELVRSLGADEVVDYTAERFWERLPPQDLCIDAMGGRERRRLLEVTRRGGRIASINSDLAHAAPRFGPYLGLLVSLATLLSFTVRALVTKGVRTSMVVRRSDGEALARIAALVESGAVRPVVDRVFDLDEIVEAHRYLESGRARGKVVIRVGASALPTPAPAPAP